MTTAADAAAGTNPTRGRWGLVAAAILLQLSTGAAWTLVSWNGSADPKARLNTLQA